jgi:lysophospholipase L1-like esterase
VTAGHERKLPIALLIASIAVSLGVAEVVLRAFDLGPSIQIIFEENYQLSDNPILEYELRPGSSHDGITINSSGFRDREFTRAKPPGIFRIAAIGDSVSFGLWVPQHTSYPKQLEVLLNDQLADRSAPYSRIEVLNFGVTGYNVTQVVENLRTRVLDYDPDLIVYGYVLNDPQADSLEGGTLRDLRDFEQRRMTEQLGHGTMRLLLHSRLATLCALVVRDWTRPTGSYARHATTGRLIDRTDDVNVPVRARGDPGGAAYEAGDSTGQYFRSLHTEPSSRKRFVEGIRDLAAVARSADVPVIVAIFPLFVSLENYPLEDVHEIIGAQGRNSGLAIADLLPAFVGAKRDARTERGLAVDFMHPSVYGHSIAANELARFIGESNPLETERSPDPLDQTR